MALIERLLQTRRDALAAGAGDAHEQEVIRTLLWKLRHPMRGFGDQTMDALLSDVGASIAPERGEPPPADPPGRHAA